MRATIAALGLVICAAAQADPVYLEYDYTAQVRGIVTTYVSGNLFGDDLVTKDTAVNGTFDIALKVANNGGKLSLVDYSSGLSLTNGLSYANWGASEILVPQFQTQTGNTVCAHESVTFDGCVALSHGGATLDFSTRTANFGVASSLTVGGNNRVNAGFVNPFCTGIFAPLVDSANSQGQCALGVSGKGSWKVEHVAAPEIGFDGGALTLLGFGSILMARSLKKRVIS